MNDVGTSLPLTQLSPSSPVGISPSLPEPVSDSSLSPQTYQIVTIAFFFASLVLSLFLLLFLVYRAILRRRSADGAELEQLEGGPRAMLYKPPELLSRDAVVVIQPDGQAELACLEAPLPASIDKATQVSEVELALPVGSSYSHPLRHLHGPLEVHLAAPAWLGHKQQGGPQEAANCAQWGAVSAGSAGQDSALGIHRQGPSTEAGWAGSSRTHAACQAG